MTRGYLKARRRQLRRSVQIATHRDVKIQVGELELSLPATSRIPDFQEDFPLYDHYFFGFLSSLAERGQDLCVFDVGANVGTTAAAVLSAAPKARLICVEGSAHFLTYLRRNTAGRDNVTIVEGFLVYNSDRWQFTSDGSTGRLVRADEELAAPKQRHLAVDDILPLAGSGVRIWKSDTDGFDIPILLTSFDAITAACEVLWIEFDPRTNASGPGDVLALLDKVGELERDVLLFDNFGHLMFRLPGAEAITVIKQLNRWLTIQAELGTPRVNYFDLWVLPADLADLLELSSTSAHGRVW